MTVYRILVKDLPKDILDEANLPTGYEDVSVMYVQKNTRTQTGEIITRFMNVRFIKVQLKLPLPRVDKREVWYLCTGQMTTLDIKGDGEQQYISMSEMVKSFAEEVAAVLGMEYWAFALDYMEIDSKEKALFMEPSEDAKGRQIVINKRDVEKFVNTPFFMLVCEKPLVFDVMSELYSKGYKRGYIGVNTGGFAVTHFIRVLLEANIKRENLYIFLMTDFDLNGLQIYLDMKKYFNVELIGTNPDFMEKYGLDFDKLKIVFSSAQKKIDALATGVKQMATSILKDEDEIEKLKGWTDKLLEGFRVELNACTSEKLRRNLPKMEDFTSEIIEKIEGRTYDINYYGTPDYRRPSFISDKINELKDIAAEGIEKYLQNMDLKYGSDWLDKTGARELYDKYVEENKTYTNTLKNVDTLLRTQSKEIMKIIDNSELAKETEVNIEEIKQKTIDLLLNKDEDTEDNSDNSESTDEN